MKKQILFILVFLPFFVQSQNYQNICSPGITFFQDSLTELKAFRLDSIHLQGNGDTIFQSYRAIRDTFDGYMSFDCSDTTNGSVLGMKIFKKHDGWFYFFNRYNDTVKINSQAALNETWKFCDIRGTGYIQAKITDIISDSILGLPDQVKVISFQAKNFGNNNIAHFLNNKFIKLSGHYGLSKMLDVYFIPSGTIFYTVSGKTGSGLGVQDFTMKDVYNFDVGDVYQYSGNSNSQGKTSWWNTIKTILGKTIFGNLDSVIYLMETCEFQYSELSGVQRTHNTTNVTYNFIGLDGDLTYSRLPDEFYGGDYFSRTPLVKGISSDFFYYSGGSHCWINSPMGDKITRDYSPGLGCTYNSYSSPSSWGFSSQSLVYYKKGNLTWGTPVAADCSELLGTQPVPNEETTFLIVLPNPIESTAEIRIGGLKYKEMLTVELYNSMGILIYQDRFNSAGYHFNRNGISLGMYFLVVSDDNGSVIGKEKIIIR